MKVRSSLAPPSPGSPESFASGIPPSSGCGLLTISAAISTAAFEACPAAAAFPVSGNRTPTFTASAACAIRAPVARLAAAALAAASTVRRFMLSLVIQYSLPAATLDGRCRLPLRLRGPADSFARPAELKSGILILSISPNPANSFGDDFAMPYDLSTITVQPSAHPKQIPALEQWLKANPRRGEFLACLVAEIGELNKVLLLHRYDSDADLAADRAAVAESANPYGIGEMIAGMTSDTFVQFPFLPAINPGQYGPIFEIRTYSLRTSGLQPTIAAWEKAVPARAKMT